jgi:hypothetical protein
VRPDLDRPIARIADRHCGRAPASIQLDWLIGQEVAIVVASHTTFLRKLRIEN